MEEWPRETPLHEYLCGPHGSFGKTARSLVMFCVPRIQLNSTKTRPLRQRVRNGSQTYFVFKNINKTRSALFSESQNVYNILGDGKPLGSDTGSIGLSQAQGHCATAPVGGADFREGRSRARRTACCAGLCLPFLLRSRRQTFAKMK